MTANEILRRLTPIQLLLGESDLNALSWKLSVNGTGATHNYFSRLSWTGGRVVEGTGLENRHTG